jgi:hypothetical protein
LLRIIVGLSTLNSECRSAGSQPKYLDAFIEFVGWRILGSMENNAALIGVVTPLPVQSTNGINIFNIKGGFRTSTGKHDSFYVGCGQAVTHLAWSKHIIRLEYRRTY